MKIAFSGSRRIEPTYNDLYSALEMVMAGREIFYDCLVGDCPTGVDKYIREYNFNHQTYIAGWSRHGKAAGPMRNQAMIDDADALVAFPCPQSKGTWDAIRKATKKGIPVVIIPIGNEVIV